MKASTKPTITIAAMLSRYCDNKSTQSKRLTNADECIDIITDMNADKICIIVSESFNVIIVLVAEVISQVNELHLHFS